LKKKPVIDIIEKESLSAITYQSPLFSSQTLNHIHDQLKLGKKIFVYAARKSIATVTTCRDCGYTVTCPNCSAIMQLIKKNPLSSTDRVFYCNRCQTEIPPMNRCPHCLGWNIVPLGITTESVFEELSKIFPGVTIYQSNNDLTKTESACKKMITSWENGGILVGTQKIIPFIRTADTSIIASFEHCMSIPDHTTTMTTLWLFQQILEKTTDRYLIQTNYPDQLFLQQFQQQNLQQILDDDYSLRSQYGFPPATTLITIVMENISRRDHPQARDFLKQPLQSFENSIQSQFFEYSQTYTIQSTIHLDNRSWQESTEPSIRRLRQLLDTLRGHASITIETPWLF
jgi:primosomal protein N' (replication factor Y)